MANVLNGSSSLVWDGMVWYGMVMMRWYLPSAMNQDGTYRGRLQIGLFLSLVKNKRRSFYSLRAL